jgi:formylglycine-generating enzyme required for sulfatase activity
MNGPAARTPVAPDPAAIPPPTDPAHNPHDTYVKRVLGATTRVIRGGVFKGTARDVRSACRVLARPDRRDYFIGFRPARGPS